MTDQDNIVSLPDRDALEMEASEWLMRLEDEDAAAEELTAFYAWRDQSDIHRAVFAEMAALWGDFDVIEGLKDRAAAARHADRAQQHGRRPLPRRAGIAAIAASLMVAVGAGTLYQAGGIGGPYQAQFETAVGERTQVELRDGSVIELNTDTQLAVTFSKTARQIQLLRGEAYFDVAPDAQKPFSVFAGEGVVTAVGTEFTVRLRDALVDVMVTEGRVALAAQRPPVTASDTPAAPTPIAELRVGQGAVFHQADDQLEMVAPDAIARKLSWREGLLSFAGEPLGEVVADISRYTHLTIDIEDEALRALPVAGFFKIDDVDAMLEALEIMADVRAERIGDSQVRLVPAR